MSVETLEKLPRNYPRVFIPTDLEVRGFEDVKPYFDKLLAGDVETVDALELWLRNLSEIGSVIELRDDGTTPCGHVTALLADKIAEVRERRVQLAALEQELIRLVDRSATLNPADCRPDDICHVLSSDGSIDASANWGPPLR